MELIKIIFFVIGTFFGFENSQIVSEKTTISINPETKSVLIIQEDLFSIIRSNSDSINVRNELVKILDTINTWRPELKDYKRKSVEFYTNENEGLNANIILEYSNGEDLKDFAIDIDEQGNYSLVNFPKWNLTTDDGNINGNYWQFDSSKPFKFTLEPFKDFPSQYLIYKKSLSPIWIDEMASRQ